MRNQYADHCLLPYRHKCRTLVTCLSHKADLPYTQTTIYGQIPISLAAMSNTSASTETLRQRISSQNVNSNHNETRAFYESLPKHNLEPLWLQLEKLVSPRPNPAASVAIWRYAEILPALMEAGRIVPVEEAERRVLMLINPSLKAPCTTDTLYAGLQLVAPGEIAPAHRHTAFALRFIIEGSSGFTAVEGEKIMMRRGDVILTPSWKWHDHGNEGTDPVIWLDGLDLPIFNLLRLNFANQYPESRYPSKISQDCTSRLPWAPVEKALQSIKGKHALYHYRNWNGDHLSCTISTQAERITAGNSSDESQETVSFIYHVVAGQGRSTILSPGMDQPREIIWSSKDTFAVPAWSRISHFCSMKEGDAFLIAINDRPLVESLGLLRTAHDARLQGH